MQGLFKKLDDVSQNIQRPDIADSWNSTDDQLVSCFSTFTFVFYKRMTLQKMNIVLSEESKLVTVGLQSNIYF